MRTPYAFPLQYNILILRYLCLQPFACYICTRSCCHCTKGCNKLPHNTTSLCLIFIWPVARSFHLKACLVHTVYMLDAQCRLVEHCSIREVQEKSFFVSSLNRQTSLHTYFIRMRIARCDFSIMANISNCHLDELAIKLQCSFY